MVKRIDPWTCKHEYIQVVIPGHLAFQKECKICGLLEDTILHCYTKRDAADQPPVSGHDPVNHPSHYTGHPSGIECIQVTEHMNFNLGNAVKYIWRCGEKGFQIQDLKKAAWYLEREIERLKKKAYDPTHGGNT